MDKDVLTGGVSKEEAVLQTKIKNYKRTRRWSKGPLQSWCDSLIAVAEQELAQLKMHHPDSEFSSIHTDNA